MNEALASFKTDTIHTKNKKKLMLINAITAKGRILSFLSNLFWYFFSYLHCFQRLDLLGYQLIHSLNHVHKTMDFLESHLNPILILSEKLIISILDCCLHYIQLADKSSRTIDHL